jgi:hypothetical protein
MKFMETLILVAFPLGLLMVAIGGIFLTKRILMPLGSLVCSASMIPLGFLLFTSAENVMDYIRGGMAMTAGILLFILGIFGLIGFILKARPQSSGTAAS